MPIQKKDIYVPTMPAITYSGPGVRWKIKEGVDVGTATGPATIFSTHANSKLVNQGYVYSYEAFAIAFAENNAKITNKETGVINGQQAGAYIATATGTKATVMNDGKIIGGGVGVYSVGPGDLKVENTGDINGVSAGIYAVVLNAGSKPGPDIVNDGSIVGDVAGIYSAATGMRTTITNKSDGLIEGGTVDGAPSGAAIGILGGSFKLKNDGKIKGDILSTDFANDKVVNSGKIKGDVYLGAGNDTYKSKDGKAGLLNGQEGNDKFVLGSKADKLVFDTALNAATNVDRVKNFEHGKDQAFLDQTIFTALSGPGQLLNSEFRKGASAQDADDHIIYQKGTGALFYDADGTGGIAQVKFAQFDAGQKLTASDFVVIA